MNFRDKVEITKSIMTIVASIAIPTVLAFYGHQIQKEISAEGLKKDYVQMAVGILNEKKEGQDTELRKWAVAVINKNSPVPFDSDLRERLEKGTITLTFRGLADVKSKMSGDLDLWRREAERARQELEKVK